MSPEGDRPLENGSPFDLGALGASAVSSLALGRGRRDGHSVASSESVKMWVAPSPRKFVGGDVVESLTVGTSYQ